MMTRLSWLPENRIWCTRSHAREEIESENAFENHEISREIKKVDVSNNLIIYQAQCWKIEELTGMGAEFADELSSVVSESQDEDMTCMVADEDEW